MFGIVDDIIDSVVDLPAKVLNGEDITREDVKKLVRGGASVAAIAYSLGVATDVIERLLEERD